MMELKKIMCLISLTCMVEGQSFFDVIRNYRQTQSNNIPSNYKPERTTYDFIVVGSGSAGSAVANRLSENPKWKILLLEAGGMMNVLNDIPMLVSVFQLTEFNWGYKVEPQTNACLGMINRQCPWPRGKTLGGTSTLNYMIHTRGGKEDYENWAKMGNKGWSWNEVLPYFKKSERFDIPELNNSTWHNRQGHVCVEYVPYHSPLANVFLRAGERLGYPIVDYNGANQIGFSFIQVNMDKGARCSAAKAYLRDQRPNLHVMTNARVTKILFDENKRAYGVEYVRRKKFHQVRCSREVVLSAGTIDSAKLLMLSGIGPKEHLEELGIPVLKDSKVGYNLYEHVGFLGLSFLVNQSVTLLPRQLARPGVLLDYVMNRKGPMTIPGGAEALAFIRSKYAQDERPDIELLFASGSLHSDNGLTLRRALGITDELYNAVYKPIEGRDAWSIWPIVQNPRSVGRIKLKSKDPFQSPIIDPNFFSHPADLEIILEGVKLAINISQSEPFRKYGSRLHDIKIPGCRTLPFGTDDYWRCAIKHLPSMMNHEIGTAKMGPASDVDAVVDPQLRVHGVTGLRVADASIMPAIPTGHSNAVIYMIGEKAADMIKQTWRSR
ncbi:glucose dehydrogenase [FAD, quinone]-like [Neodiprion pinetum]|uniref:Glucose dehydrogenase [FAD, quinone] n=1 Tax=Neodiprion lecontei TaxID=441921 RepID=A0A6J0BCE7_NEOLC|nr:glucose dehydrogenase [FAD, quinone] [Neodiprion lecontei]XP_046469052.1 glucose dehydrogenase [FAD, quinone]-like [Neodiprion pinetum]